PRRSTDAAVPRRLGVLRLELAAAPSQRVLGVAVRLLQSIEHEVERRLERDALLELRRHVAVVAVARVLPIDDLRHALERRTDLLLIDDAVAEPVRNVLRRDAQRRAVLHEPDVVDVGDLRAADTLLDPAHDIAQDSLRVVVELALNLRVRELSTEQRRSEDSLEQLRSSAAFRRNLALARG